MELLIVLGMIIFILVYVCWILDFLLKDYIRHVAKKDIFTGISNIIIRYVSKQDKDNDCIKELEDFFYTYLNIKGNAKYLGELTDLQITMKKILMFLNIRNDRFLKKYNIYGLKDRIETVHSILNILDDMHPYNKYTDSQQDILKSIQKRAIDNSNNEKLILLEQIKKEFNKLNLDIKMNIRNNKISSMISIIGTIISIISLILSVIFFFASK